jgi:hypothetical protein
MFAMYCISVLANPEEIVVKHWQKFDAEFVE